LGEAKLTQKYLKRVEEQFKSEEVLHPNQDIQPMLKEEVLIIVAL
jgi:hypothetical protein